MCITLKRVLLILLLICGGDVYIAMGQEIQKAQIARQYYDQGDFEKAINTYDELAKSKINIPFIHAFYFDLLIARGKFSDAAKYLEKVKKWYPQNLNYIVDEGELYLKSDNPKKANATFEEVINKASGNPTLTRTVAQYFFQKNLTEQAIEMYLRGRKRSGNKTDFSIELANVYRRTNNKEEMIAEYLNFISENPANLGYVENVMQNLLTEPEDLEALQTVLYDKIQKENDNQVYNELIIWVNLQLKNFYNAFIQARALDKRAKEGGKRLLEIGTIALQNKDYKNAELIFNYILKTYKSGRNYEIARRYLIKAREEIIKTTFPVDNGEIKSLISDYNKLIADLGINNVTLEALRSKALLHAFYLDEKDSAIQFLKRVISTPQANQSLVAQSKLDLGDIYLLKGEPWESTLLYSQVEKSSSETLLGYEAKLKNAKLSYYTGDFELAQAHLDVLKMATSREISNDAMALSLLIQDNIAFDTSKKAMKDYAAIDLLLFQNKKRRALEKLDEMLTEYPGHSLTDEIWWRKAQILLELGNFEESIALLDKIVNNYPYDILSDDAYFLMGTIWEDQLNQQDKAMEVYQQLLTKYPGSLYAAEARKRFRHLRGDFSQDSNALN